MADQLDYVKVLRQNHANIDIQSTDFKKVTALMDACSNGFVDIIEYLLEAGADVNLRDKAGWSAADHFKNYVQEYENEHWSDEDKSKARHWIKKLALLETNTKIIKEERSVYQAERGLPEDVDSIFIQPDINEIKSNVKCRPRNEQPASRAPSLSSDRRSPPAQKKSRLALKRKRIDDTFPRIAAEKKSLSESQRLEVFSKKSKFFDHVVDAPIEEPRELVAVSSTTLPSSTPSILRGTSMSYTVRVHDKLLLVPTPSSATVKDLADETARRYLESHGRKPFLRLTTVDGAELHPGDKLEAIFDARSSVSHRIESIVDQWNTGPIDETYERLCTKTGEMQFTDCKAKLVGAVTQGLLSMDRCGLVCPSALNPVLKASEDQASIRQIHVPNCRIAIRISLFCKTVSTLSNLTVLNLANNGLSATNLHDLQKISPNLGRVRVLDLSFNFLGDECSTTMAKILANLTELTTLSIKSCHLTSQFFRRRKEDFKQSLKGLSDVDVSYNRLGSIGVVDFLTCLDVTLVRSINLSGCVMYASDDKKLADTLESFLNDSAVLGYVGFRRNAIDLAKFPSHLQRFLKCGH
jgi:Leucine-rich repeat (LRR) protein